MKILKEAAEQNIDIDTNFLVYLEHAKEKLRLELQYEENVGGYAFDEQLKQAYVKKQCRQMSQIAAQLLIDAFVYVPEKKFIDELHHTCMQFCQTKLSDVNYFLILHKDMDKSNYFYSLIAFQWLGDHVFPIQEDVFLATNPGEHVILVDDGIYSGTQMRDHVWVFYKTPLKTVSVVVPYVTEHGLDNVAYLDMPATITVYHAQIMHTLAQSIDPKYHTYLRKYGPAELVTGDGPTEFEDPANVEEDFDTKSTTYFYHRVGDEMSSFPHAISHGFHDMQLWPKNIIGFNSDEEMKAAWMSLGKSHGPTIGLADHCTPVNQLKTVRRSTPKRSPLIKNCPVETGGHRRRFESGKCPPPYYKGNYLIE